MGLLQTEGRIRRIPVDGRLDQQRYRYVRWDDGPLANEAKPAEQARAELAALYWAWAGPATLGHFRWFSGLGAKVARDALSDLDLVAVEADIGGLDGLLALKADADALADFELPAAPNVELVASIDSMVLLRRDLSTCMVPADLGHPLLAAEKGSGGTLADLPHHATVDRGRVIGPGTTTSMPAPWSGRRSSRRRRRSAPPSPRRRPSSASSWATPGRSASTARPAAAVGSTPSSGSRHDPRRHGAWLRGHVVVG